MKIEIGTIQINAIYFLQHKGGGFQLSKTDVQKCEGGVDLIEKDFLLSSYYWAN